MCIDLKNNKLHIGTTGTSTPFLGESELPSCARLTALSEEEARRESEAVAKESEDRALAQALAASAKDRGAEGEPSGGAGQQGTSSQGRNWSFVILLVCQVIWAIIKSFSQAQLCF